MGAVGRAARRGRPQARRELETPTVMAALLDEAKKLGLGSSRISQQTGVGR